MEDDGVGRRGKSGLAGFGMNGGGRTRLFWFIV